MSNAVKMSQDVIESLYFIYFYYIDQDTIRLKVIGNVILLLIALSTIRHPLLES